MTTVFGGRRRGARGQRQRHAAGLPQPVRRLRGSLAGGGLSAGVLACPVVRGAASTCPAGRGRRRGCSWGRCRCCATGPTASGSRSAHERRSRACGGLATGSPRRAPPPAAAPEGERCDLCGRAIAEDHRHLLTWSERRIECACEACIALRSGDREYRPVGTRVAWLPDLVLDDERWAAFGIPIGLAFFMRSTISAGVVAMYPSPAGADRVRAGPVGLGPAGGRQPGADHAGGRRRGR